MAIDAAPPTAQQTGVTSAAGAVLADAESARSASLRGDIWRRFRRNKLALAGLTVIVLMVLAAVFAPLVTFYSPGALGSASRANPSLKHWFGTDVLGRDLYTRVVYGARVSLKIGILAVLIASAIGLVIGAITGFYGGKLDGFLMRTTDIFLAFPYILAAIVIITVIGRGEKSVILVLGLLGWMSIARLFRASVLRAKRSDYVEAARAVGCSDLRIIVRHILPNAIQPVIVYATIFVGTAVLAEAALSFLGAGVTEPTPAWGLMVAQGRSYLFTSPNLLFFPAAAILVTVMAFVFVGDGLRDALDPRLR
ncbi:MAG TPA: ABC transporter permease [Actinomycetota bacterium]|nr:ABC transporter permease [Actinomycetota bacterium]